MYTSTVVNELEPSMGQAKIGPETPSKGLYRLAAVMALLIVVAGLTDAITSMGVEAQDNRSVAVAEWFALFQTDGFAAFSRLGVINMITITLSVPIYLAFNQAFRQQRRALVAFVSLLFFLGAAAYLSSNTVFPLYALSRQYAVASAAQKPVLEAAGYALLAQGADLTPGTLIGLLFIQIAGMLMTGAMLRGAIFGKWAGRVGMAGYSLMIVFFILAAFVPEVYDAALLISAPGGLLLMVYQIMLARRFFQLAKSERIQK